MSPNTRQSAKFLAASLAALPALNASANGFALPDQDAFATARGEAVVATADDPSAVYYNPAGITQLEGHNVRGGVYLLDYHTTFEQPTTGKKFYEEDNFAAIPRFFYTYSPADFPLSLGLGVYSPFGGKMSWPNDTGFYSVASNGKLTYITINPVVAWKISPTLSVAAGPMVNYVDMNMDQGLLPDAPPVTPFANFFRFDGNGWSVGYNLGARWQPLDQLSFGATFRSPSKVSLDGQADFENQPFIPNSSRSASMDLTFPMSAVIGVSYRPTPKWNLEFDASYTDWSSFGSTAILQPNPLPPFRNNTSVTLDWESSWMYEFGVTRYFDNGWHISAGYCFSENSVPDSYYTPLAADMDRHFFSVGSGWKGRHLSFDVAYQFGYGPEHTVTGSQPSTIPGTTTGQNADGKYSFYSNAVSVSVGWHF